MSLHQTLLAAFDLHKNNQLVQARQLYEQILKDAPDHLDANNLLGLIFVQINEHTLAIEHFSKVINVNPQFSDAFYNRGDVFRKLGDFDSARADYEKALSLQATLARHVNFGLFLVELGELELALTHYDQALHLDAHNAITYYNKGICLRLLRRYQESLACYEKALNLMPNFYQAYNNMGNVYRDLEKFDRAFQCFNQALLLKSDFIEALHNRALTRQLTGEIDLALQDEQMALQISPDYQDAQFTHSVLLLTTGDYEKGWQAYESRWQLKDVKKLKKPMTAPLWLGDSDLTGKTLLVYNEQGMGDTIQFCRYVSLIKKQATKIIVVTEPPLCELLSSLQGVDEVIDIYQDIPHHDFCCPFMSLPLAFKTFSLNEIPHDVPYLFPSQEKINYWQKKIGEKTKPRIGFVWKGGFRPEHPVTWLINKRRNIPFNYIARLQSFDCEFYSLQKDGGVENDFSEEEKSLWYTDNLHRYTQELQNFADTAALIAQMDLVITVDTSTAHLSGAMGKPVWLLNRFDTCWRWFLDREDSPWYPTMRIFRQIKFGDWESVAHKLMSAFDRELQFLNKM